MFFKVLTVIFELPVTEVPAATPLFPELPVAELPVELLVEPLELLLSDELPLSASSDILTAVIIPASSGIILCYF